MRTAVHRAARRLGRRGAVLTFKGIMAAIYGYSLLVQPPQDTRGIRLLLDLMPLHAWGWVWIGAGLLAIGCAWRQPGRDWLGYPAICLVVAPWALGSLASWWLYDNPRGWASAVVWGAFGGVAAIAAEWPEPPHNRWRP
ncbi:hypothetical protein [Kitasatospora sp. NPDC127116]|uniref:hypothetical protein n=1 Tax=Kitasatospora sp. NPDC127116 TaxID=3345367 RepID=UPI0036343B1B